MQLRGLLNRRWSAFSTFCSPHWGLQEKNNYAQIKSDQNSCSDKIFQLKQMSSSSLPQHTHIHALTHALTHTCTHAHIHSRTCTHTHTYTQSYRHMHIRTFPGSSADILHELTPFPGLPAGLGWSPELASLGLLGLELPGLP